MNGCKDCPAFRKCTVIYGGSACAALRSTYGVDDDLEIITNAEMKPCPFCGGEAEAVYGRCDYNVWQVRCLNDACQAMAGWCDTKDAAIAAWNRRAVDKPTPPEWQRALYRKFTHGREL